MDARIISFLDSHRMELIQIYIKERQSKGEGILMITKVEDKVNVGYLAIYEMPVELYDEFIKKKENKSKDSIIYFYVCSSIDNAQLMEIDLDNSQ